MSTKKMLTMGVLSVLAATGLVGASNGFAADGRTTSHVGDVTSHADVAAQAPEVTMDTRTVSDDVKISATQQQVVDSKGNVYLLIPLQTKEGKAFIGYTIPTAH